MTRNLDSKPLVTICLLTFNGAIYLKDLLKKVFIQNVPFPFEVIAIDSESTDDTLKILEQFSVQIIHIKNKDFGHGKTRNFAWKNARGKFVVFLVQDATPTSKYWLEELMQPMLTNNKVVATYGKHIPRRNANPFIKRDIEGQFAAISQKNTITYQCREPKKNYSRQAWGLLQFFSDVNAALRISFLKRHPYKNIQYSEDYAMGKTIIEGGFTKAYVPKAAVYHSHTYPLGQYLFRYFDEYIGIKTSLGVVDQKSFLKLIVGTIRGWRDDAKYIAKMSNVSIWYKLQWISLSVYYNFLRRSASLLVTYENRLPNWLQHWLSMEYKVKKQNQKRLQERRKNDFSIA